MQNASHLEKCITTKYVGLIAAILLRVISETSAEFRVWVSNSFDIK